MDAADEQAIRFIDSAFGYFVVGQLHLQKGDELNAELAFQRAARLDPTDPRARVAQDELRQRRDEEV